MNALFMINEDLEEEVGMKGRKRAILVVILQMLALLAIISIGPATAPVMGATVPPVITGDWVIAANTTEVYTGGTCDITGNIIIESGGVLTLHGATIRMAPPSNGGTRIEVKGTLNADNSTFETSTAFNYNWQMDLQTSIGNLFDNDISGQQSISIKSGFVTMVHNDVHDSYFGLLIKDPLQPMIKANTFYNINQRALDIWGTNAKVLDNVIRDSNTGADVAAVVISDGNPTFLRNTIKDNSGVGTVITDFTLFELRDNTFDNPGATDISVEGNTMKTTVNCYNTTYTTVGLNTIVTAYDAIFRPFWTVDITVTSESDGSPLDGAQVEVRSPDGDLLAGGTSTHTDTSGKVVGLEVPELEMYHNTTVLKTTDYKPHVVWAMLDAGLTTIATNKTIPIDSDMAIPIVLDDIIPDLDITDPQEGSRTSDIYINITGVTEPTAKVTVKGDPVTVEADGSFIKNVKLFEGKNAIKIISTDISGNKNITTLTVIRDTIAPTVTILSPQNDSTVTDPKTEVRGTAEFGSLLWINNRPVDVEEDGTFSTIINLIEGKNTITALSKDQVNNSVSFDIIVTLDSTAPTLVVVEPGDGKMTSESVITIKGITERDANLTIEGDPVNLIGTSFRYTANLLEGENIITLIATDPFGNTVTQNITIYLDTIAPGLTINTPTNLQETNKDTIIVEGTTEPDATVKVNGLTTKNNDGNFSTSVKLDQNNNKITIKVTDPTGNTYEEEIRVIKDLIPPELVIVSPQDGVLLNSQSNGLVEVSGTTESDALIFVNDDRILVSGTGFTTPVELEEGNNTIVVMAQDPAGNTVKQTIGVNYDGGVEYQVLSPSDLTTTKAAKIEASGTVEAGGSVLINGENAVVESDGSFTQKVKLDSGDNTVTFVFEDEAGNSKIVTVHVTRKGGEKVAAGMSISPSILIGIIVAVIVVVLVILIIKKRPAQPTEEESDEPPPPDFTAGGTLPPPPPQGSGGPEPGYPPPPPPGYQASEPNYPSPPPPPPGYQQ